MLEERHTNFIITISITRIFRPAATLIPGPSITTLGCLRLSLPLPARGSDQWGPAERQTGR